MVSLTLTPMMCARLLKHKPEHEQGALYRFSERVFVAVIRFYGRTLTVILRHQPMTLLVAAGTLAATIYLFWIIPKGFFPVQDTGVILELSEAPQNDFVSGHVPAALQELAKVILKDPEAVDSFVELSSASDNTNTTLNSGRIQINLKPLEDWPISASDVIPAPVAAAGPRKWKKITLFMQPAGSYRYRRSRQGQCSSNTAMDDADAK